MKIFAILTEVQASPAELALKAETSTFAMFKELLEVLDEQVFIIEIGCNAGRNLNYLLEQGYY
mgnify:CR=1 FL=1